MVGIFFQWISIIGSKQLDLIEVHIIKSFKNRILWKKNLKFAFGKSLQQKSTMQIKTFCFSASLQTFLSEFP